MGRALSPTGAILGFQVTTKVPFVGTVRCCQCLCALSFLLLSVLNHVYHLVGIPLEMQEYLPCGFDSAVAIADLPCRCFLNCRGTAPFSDRFEYFVIIWPNITKAAYGLDGDQPFVRGTPEYFKERVGLLQLSTSQEIVIACECLHLLADDICSQRKGTKISVL